jgi:uncharacterized membrane protein
MRSRIPGFVFLIVLGVAAGTGRAAGQQLVTLPVGSHVHDVTPDGEIVAGTWDFGDGFIWRWRVDPSPTVILGGSITGISDDGLVACGNTTDPGSGESVAGIWTAATGWQSIGYMPGTPDTCGGGLSSAYDISGDGSTIVGLAWINGCNGAGFRWTAGTGMEPLEHLANGHNRCSAISGDGSVLGGFAQGTSSRTPAYWAPDNSGAVLDPNLQGEVYNFTEDGSLSVGTLYFTGSLYSAFVRDQQTGAMTDLGALQSGFAAAASDLSEDASVIVGFDYISLSRKAWVWSAADGMIGLKERLTALGLTGVPNLLVCSAVSNDGSVVVGLAEAAGGGPFGWGGFIVDLPKPSSQWSNLLGGLPGINGVPKLVGNGALTAGSHGSVVLTKGKPSAPAALAVGLSAALLPFKQGVLVPHPNFLFGIPALSSAGSVSLSFTWPSGVPSGFQLWWQFMIKDAAAPAGVSLSNALESQTP